MFFLVVVVGGTLNEISCFLCKCVSVVRFVVVGTINKLMACVSVSCVYICISVYTCMCKHMRMSFESAKTFFW